MKTLLAAMLVLALSASAPLMAGDTGKVVLEGIEPVNAELFGDGELQVEGFAIWGDFDSSETTGGGLGVSLFLTRNLGVRLQGAWGRNEGTDLGIYTGDVIFRMPLESLGIAPYIYGGGGAGDLNADDLQGLLRGGLGLEWRITPGLGFFAEGNYTWTESADDYAQVLGGIRLNL